MFADAKAFNQPIGKWNVSNVTDMQYMFSGAEAFNQPIGNWNVSNVLSVECMFADAKAFNQFFNWTLYKAKNTFGMFDGAKNFKYAEPDIYT